MKKTLIALAAVAATTGAMAQATISGQFDIQYQQQKNTYGNNVSRSANTFENSNVGTSAVIFRGNEDLGGGLRAEFLYEMNFDASATSGSPTAGQIFVGVTGGFGTIRLGAVNTPTLTAQSNRSGFGSKIGGGRGGFSVGGTARTRTSDTIHYASPAVAGFSVAVAHTPKLTAAANPQLPTAALSTAINDIGAFYSAGPLAAGIAKYEQKDVVDQTTAYASYTMGPAKFTVGYFTQDNKTSAADAAASSSTAATIARGVGKVTGNNIAVDYALNANTSLMLNVAKADDKSSVNRDLKMTAVGVRHNLSKRTSLHARVINEKRDNVLAAATMVSKKQTTTLLGLQHNF
jgi:predicted porin